LQSGQRHSEFPYALCRPPTAWPFCDFHPGWQICKTFIQSTHGFSQATEELYWTHIHELPDLLSPALCYSSRVTCDARCSRRALLGFRATAPAPPRFERAAFPLLYLPGSVVSRFGRILVLKAKGEVSAHPYTDRE
jgi:hypothetical protein